MQRWVAELSLPNLQLVTYKERHELAVLAMLNNYIACVILSYGVSYGLWNNYRRQTRPPSRRRKRP